MVALLACRAAAPPPVREASLAASQALVAPPPVGQGPLSAQAPEAAPSAQKEPPPAPAEKEPAPLIVHAIGGKGGVTFEVQEAAPHIRRTVDVGNGVVLEVLDWGGGGETIVLLAGLGNSAHIFDDFAPAFVDRWRVLGVSRRGFGGSTVTPSGYDAPNLGGDTLRALDALEIQRAIFVGHSIAGEELTWLGSEHPGRVLALVYLDAAYDRVAGRPHRPPPTPEPPTTPAELANPTAYAARLSRFKRMPMPLDEVLASSEFAPDGHFLRSSTNPKVVRQIAQAVRSPDYTKLAAPTLAVYALARHWTADYAAHTARERERFAREVPSARIVTIPRSRHYLFLTNRDEVVSEIRGFLDGLTHATSGLGSKE